MPIHKYLSEAGSLVEELKESISDEDAAQCHKTLLTAGERFWVTFLHKKRPDILAYLEKTPAQRKKTLAKLDGLHQLLIPLGALCYAKAGLVQYEAAIEIYEHVPGKSYRKGLAVAADSLVPGTWPADIWPLQTPCPFDASGS